MWRAWAHCPRGFRSKCPGPPWTGSAARASMRSARPRARCTRAGRVRALAALANGFFEGEIVPVAVPQKKGDPLLVSKDEHPRDTTLEALAKLKGVVRPDGSVTAGNASGINDGACALLLADESAAARHGL